MRWSLLRTWAVGALAVSAVLFLFMIYLVPLPFVRAQDYSDRVAVSMVSLVVLFIEVAGFVAIGWVGRSSYLRDRGASLALQVAAGVLAFFAYTSVGLGA